jgi:hypothetical protein
MKLSLLFVLFLVFLHPPVSAQNAIPFGELKLAEANFNTYEKDSSAHAVVLYERGDTYFEVISNQIKLVKKYHAKIKILDEQGFDEGNIAIPFYHNATGTEEVTGLKAMTHNGTVKTNVLPSQMFKTDESPNWSQKKFTFPQVQKGSILEYQYTIISPYFFNFNGWDFQSHIPKLYSEFNAKIPGNYIYNRTLRGTFKLDKNEADIQKECFRIEGYAHAADCEVLKYSMKDIPAFKEEEEYMLAASNYISRIEFELSEHRRLDGVTDRYTKSWKDVDAEFRADKDIGQQLTKKGFFEKNVPATLLEEGDPLTRAKNIYAFIQKHYSWNGKYGIYGNNRVKEAFALKAGNVAEINMSLINLLNAADIKTNVVLLSTRNNGLPKQEQPVMSDFNYLIAKIDIEGKEYLLDATDKIIPFGMLPFRCLNYWGRVMDFKNESYWYPIKAEEKNKFSVLAQIDFNLEEEMAYGTFDQITSGYDAVAKRGLIRDHSKESYIQTMEKGIRGDFDITSYTFLEDRSDDKRTWERFEFELKNIQNSDMLYFNPFVFTFFEKNPFILEQRNYPIDFGFARIYSYQAKIVLPEGYEVQELPKKREVILEGNKGMLNFFYLIDGNRLSVSFDLSLPNSYYDPASYDALKALFGEVTEVQNNSLIVLKRK